MKIVLALLLLPSSAMAQEKIQSSPMSFPGCLQTIRNTANHLRVAPVNVVSTKILRVVRLKTSDGSVLIRCSRPDHKMLITTSLHRS